MGAHIILHPGQWPGPGCPGQCAAPRPSLNPEVGPTKNPQNTESPSEHAVHFRRLKASFAYSAIIAGTPSFGSGVGLSSSGAGDGPG
eukprot:759338-Hanusia_phi.AAC.5